MTSSPRSQAFAAGGLARWARAAPGLFPAGSGQGELGATATGAKAEIWSDAAGFTAAWKDLDTAVAALSASTDEASFKAAFPALGAACKGCHEKFRQAE